MNASATDRKDAAISFLRLVMSNEVRRAYDSHVSPGLRHHHPDFESDAKSLMQGMEESAIMHPNKVLEINHVLADGDFVALHAHVRMKLGDEGVALVHLYRFDGERIAEIWEIAQAVPAASPNSQGMF